MQQIKINYQAVELQEERTEAMNHYIVYHSQISQQQ